ncbi:molybdate ABC transporter substrate-binding protein [uncultured Methylibium sp.]|uniref:molybdate ABC transporter substrate-binding protein n=1 Tax=uncultured Methylibium sp. TaxID=381093 RepID=UPI0025E49B57|nr:molybdate ABC transporter substrate-binding protein [uncultured Methylibium sp.]
MRRGDLARALAMAMGVGLAGGAAAQPAELVVYAAGSLRAALTEVGRRYEALPEVGKVRFVFGASGLLKDRLVAGEEADLFASANMQHPQALADAGKAGAVQRFARNRLCLLARPEARVTTDNLLGRLLDPAVRVGTSTPKADPSGDYTWEMFRKLAARGGPYAGAYETLDRKALQLTGGPGSPPPPTGRSVYGALLEGGQADVFVTYCTNALQARQEVPGLQLHDLPDDVNVAADYGVVRLGASGARAQRFLDLLLGAEGQAILRRQGFAEP